MKTLQDYVKNIDSIDDPLIKYFVEKLMDLETQWNIIFAGFVDLQKQVEKLAALKSAIIADFRAHVKTQKIGETHE